MINRAALARGAPDSEHVVGDGEFLEFEAKALARRLNLVLAERSAMRRGGALLVRRAETDDGLAADQARPRVGERFLDGAADVGGVEPVALDRMPLRRLVARDHVLVARQIRRAVDGDIVVVPQDYQPPEPEVPGEPDRLVVHSLHQAPITADAEG